MELEDAIDKALESIIEAKKCQEGMHEAWRSSKKDLVELYDKRASHCEKIASLYLDIVRIRQ